MSIYWFLLTITAIIAYIFGSMDTMVLASNFVFHRNLKRLGDHTRWVSNFRRLYGLPGFLKLLLIEVVKDVIPLVVGSLLLGIRSHSDVGCAFAGFVMVLGRLWPVFYRFKGSSAALCMIVVAFSLSVSAGAATLIVTAAVVIIFRYISLGALAGAVICTMVSVLSVDDSLVLRLTIFTVLLILVHHIPALIRIVQHTEPRISTKEDITYKLGQ